LPIGRTVHDFVVPQSVTDSGVEADGPGIG